MADRKTITECVTMLCEAFGRKLSRTLLLAFEAGLAGLTDKACQEATVAALQQNRSFMPSPGELRELATTGGVSVAAKAELAFEEVLTALHNYHSEGMAELSPLTRAIARQLGDWPTWGQTPLTEVHTWKRKAFLEAYTTILQQDPERVAALTENRKSGMAIALNTLPTREQIEQQQETNRRQLQQLAGL